MKKGREKIFFFVSCFDLFLPTHCRCWGLLCPWSHSVTHTHTVWLLWMRDGPVTRTSTQQHTTSTRDSY